MPTSARAAASGGGGMMRVAYICCDPGVPVFGCKGCSVHVQEVLREFVRRGAEIDLYATRVGGSPPLDLQDVRLHTINMLKTNDSSQRERALHDANGMVKDLLATNGPYDLVYERYSLYSSAAMEYARNRITPGILEVNSPLVEEQAKYRTLTNRELAEQTTRQSMNAAGAVVAVSRAVADYVKQQRISSANVHVVPNGVDTTRFAGATERTFPRRQGEFTVGFIGTLKPWHGVANLIDAFGLMAESNTAVRLVIVGDGPERERLEQRAADLPTGASQNIQFTGAVPPSEVPALLMSMDVAVAPFLPKDDFYFSPLKIFETMAAGLPTVASRIGQIPELIEDGETGLLYPPGDIHSLAKALLILSQSPEQCAQIGKAARATMVERFTWESVISRILDIATDLRKQSSPVPKPHIHFHEQHVQHTTKS